MTLRRTNRVATAVLVMGGVLLPPAPASAATVPVDVTCLPHSSVVGDDPGNGIVLSGPVHAGDTLEVHYHACYWVQDDPRFPASAASAGLVEEYLSGIGQGYDLPASDGVLLMPVTAEQVGGDVVAQFIHSPSDWIGTIVLQPYRPTPTYTLVATRSATNCTRVTVILDGVPGSADLKVGVTFFFGPKHISTSFQGTGGTGGSWSHTFTATGGNYPLPKTAVRMGMEPYGAFFDGVDRSVTIGQTVRVPACRRA